MNTLLALEDDTLSTVIRSFFGFSVEVVRRFGVDEICEEKTDGKYSNLAKTKFPYVGTASTVDTQVRKEYFLK